MAQLSTEVSKDESIDACRRSQEVLLRLGHRGAQAAHADAGQVEAGDAERARPAHLGHLQGNSCSKFRVNVRIIITLGFLTSLTHYQLHDAVEDEVLVVAWFAAMQEHVGHEAPRLDALVRVVDEEGAVGVRS